VWACLVRERIGLARTVDAGGAPQAQAQDHNFTLNGAHAVQGGELRLPELLTLCLHENARRFAGYDARLQRPTTVPSLARLAVRLLRPWRTSRGTGKRG